MNCNDFLQRHTEWIDGVLEPSAAHELMAHVNTCPSCARYDRVVRRGTDLVRQLCGETQVSADFEPRLRHRLYHERDAMARRRTGVPVYAAAASFLLVTVGAAAFALDLGRTPVVDGPVVFAAAPAAMTSVAKHARAVEAMPAMEPEDVPAPPKPADAPARAAAQEAAAVDAQPAPWPVYSRREVAVVFPASRNDGAARPADFRPVGSRSTVTPLLIRY